MFDEVGLAGEVRPVQRGQERLREAAKLGTSAKWDISHVFHTPVAPYLSYHSPSAILHRLVHPLHRKNRQPLNLLLRLIRLRHNHMREADDKVPSAH